MANGNQNRNNGSANLHAYINLTPVYVNPLIQACLQGSTEEVHDVLREAEKHIDVFDLVNRPNDAGVTPITAVLFVSSSQPSDVITSEKQEAVLDELESFGADFEAPDGNGMYPVYLALCADFPVAFHVFNKGDVTQTIQGGINLLMYAASMGLHDVIDVIENDFDNKNEQDNQGNTALHHAILRHLQLPTRMIPNHPGEVVGLLCAIGVDSQIENANGQTAFDLAIERHMYDVALEIRHCEFPKDLMRKIRIQIRPDEIIEYYINHRDTVSSVKQALFFDDYRQYDFIYPGFRRSNGQPTPNAMKLMEDEREFGDYNIKNGELIIVQPRIRAGLKGGKRKTQRKRR
jgi:hypothetical protein